MNEVIIHIGMHKTGSTSIQSALMGYNDGQTRTASFQQKNHSIPMYTIFSEHRYNYHIWENRGVKHSAINKMRNEFLNTLEQDLRDNQHERLIISGEDISILQRDEKHELVKFFIDRDMQVKVFIYVRNPLDYAMSRTQQFIKQGLNNHSIHLNYQNTISPFIPLLSRDNIFVYNYDAVIRTHSDVVSHFSQCANIKLEALSRQNTALNSQQLALIFKLNSVPLKVLGNPMRFQIRQTLYDSIIKHFSHSQPLVKLDKYQFEYLIDPASKKDCKWLRDNFNIDYNFNTDVQHRNLEKYFDFLLADIDNRLAQMFDELGLQYDTDSTIENNFLEAYLALTEKRYNDFDKKSYLRYNPDVAEAGVNPYEHFIKHGAHEGRRY